MTKEKRNRIYELVKIICGTATILPEAYNSFDNPIPDVPTDNTVFAAYQLLKEVGVSAVAEIEEIPVCWDNQTVIRFRLGKNTDNNTDIFDLSAGVNLSEPSCFFLDLYIENDNGKFQVENDDDVGIFLIRDSWKIEEDKIVG